MNDENDKLERRKLLKRAGIATASGLAVLGASREAMAHPGTTGHDSIVNIETVAALKSRANISLGEAYMLKERASGIFDAISGTGMANDYNILSHDTLNISFVLRVGGERVNAVEYGVIGNGIVDDTAAIESLRDFTGPKRTMWFPFTDASYKLSKPIQFQDAYKIDGDRAAFSPLAGFVGTNATDMITGTTRTLTHMFIFNTDASSGVLRINDISGPRKTSARIGEGILFDGANICEGGVLIERMPNSTIKCEGQNMGRCVEGTVYNWGTKYDNLIVTNFTSIGLAIGDGANGVVFSSPVIWGGDFTPSTGIDIHGNNNGVAIHGGFIEKVGVGVYVDFQAGPVKIDSVDFEVIGTYVVDAKGDLTSPPGRKIGPVGIDYCFASNITGAAFRSDNAVLKITNSRLRSSTNFETVNQGVIIEEDNVKELGNGIVPGSTVFSLTRTNKIREERNYMPRRSSTWADENYTYNYTYLDAPATESSGFKYSSSYQGGGRYLGTSEWYLNEVRSAAIFQKLGVKLDNRVGQFAFVPADSDNVVSCGQAANRWSEIFTTNSVINASDEREKTALESISEAERSVAKQIKKIIGKFRFKEAVKKKGNRARHHFGVSAQAIGEVFMEYGLNPNDYSLFCFDEWYIKNGKQVLGDEEGAVCHSRYGIRYEELLIFMIATL